MDIYTPDYSSLQRSAKKKVVCNVALPQASNKMPSFDAHIGLCLVGLLRASAPRYSIGGARAKGDANRGFFRLLVHSGRREKNDFCE